ncbi:MAG TPA: hypothetical protein VNE22_03305 [Acidimicrobiales bacterium]|nr:hypothetical protein [Acidimicrobiales bacterium]
MSEGFADSLGREALDAFLSQAASAPDAENESRAASSTGAGDTAPSMKLRRRMAAFLFEKKPSSTSSLVPRTVTGARTRVFPFNGNGRGR